MHYHHCRCSPLPYRRTGGAFVQLIVDAHKPSPTHVHSRHDFDSGRPLRHRQHLKRSYPAISATPTATPYLVVHPHASCRLCGRRSLGSKKATDTPIRNRHRCCRRCVPMQPTTPLLSEVRHRHQTRHAEHQPEQCVAGHTTDGGNSRPAGSFGTACRMPNKPLSWYCTSDIPTVDDGSHHGAVL